MSKQNTHSKDDWHREDIMAAIRKKGTSLAELGRHHGYANATVLYNVFYKPYPKVERIIAAFLEVEPADIWPSRYRKPAIDFKTNLAHSHVA